MRNFIKAFGILLFRVVHDTQDACNIPKIEFLFLKASYANGHWTPPKGLHEKNEIGLDTAIRETFEETGLDKKKYKLLDFERTLKYNVGEDQKETTYYLASLINNDEDIKLSDEHVEYKWIQSNESDDYCLPSSLTYLLKDADAYVKQLIK